MLVLKCAQIFFAAPRDVQLLVGFSVSDMEYACLCLLWVGTQVVSSIVFANVSLRGDSVF